MVEAQPGRGSNEIPLSVSKRACLRRAVLAFTVCTRPLPNSLNFNLNGYDDLADKEHHLSNERKKSLRTKWKRRNGFGIVNKNSKVIDKF